MKHFLKKVVLFLEDSLGLATCILLIEKCNEAGMAVEVFTAAELLQEIENYREQALYICDQPMGAEVLLTRGFPTLIYYHEKNKQLSFPKCRYAMENPHEIEAEYLEQVFRRYVGLPWDILETRYLRLREATVGDVERFWEMYREPSLTMYAEGLHATLEEEENYVREYIGSMYHFYEFGVWTVLRKGTDEVIGKAGLSVRDGYELPELGYVIDVKHQRKGYAYEACKGILRYAVEFLGYQKIGAVVHKENAASIGLLKKLGFIYVKAHDDVMDYYIVEV